MNIVEFFGKKIKPMMLKGKYMVCPIETGKITDNIYAIRDKDVNMFIYKEGNDVIAIDCGYKNSSYIKKEFEKIDLAKEEITDVFLTHADLDHAGGVDFNSKSLFPNVNVYLGKEEEKYIKKIYPRKKLLFLDFYTPIRLNEGYNLLTDKEVINIGNIKIEAISTPGHTLGHMSYLINDKYLFVGDSTILVKGDAYCHYEPWNVDSGLNKKSLNKLSKLENIEMMFTSHTGYTRDFKKTMKTINKSLDWKKKDFKVHEDAPYDPYKR